MELKEKNCFQLKIRWGLSTSGVSSIDRMFFFSLIWSSAVFFIYFMWHYLLYEAMPFFIFWCIIGNTSDLLTVVQMLHHSSMRENGGDISDLRL